MFHDLGGLNVDLNFFIEIDGLRIPPLICSIISGHTKMVELILKNKSLDINITDETGTNSFWLACFYGYGEIIKLVAEAGADVLNKDKDGNNALHMACKRNNI